MNIIAKVMDEYSTGQHGEFAAKLSDLWFAGDETNRARIVVQWFDQIVDHVEDWHCPDSETLFEDQTELDNIYNYSEGVLSIA